MPTRSYGKNFSKAVQEGKTNEVLNMIDEMPTQRDKLLLGFGAFIIAKDYHHDETAEKLKEYLESISNHMAPQKLLADAKAGYTRDVIHRVDEMPDSHEKAIFCGCALTIAAINNRFETMLALQEYIELYIRQDPMDDYLDILRN